MEWKEEFSVGINEIDKEHQLLVHCVTDIEDVVTKGERWYEVPPAIGRFVVFLRIHFYNEESLMRTFNYPDVAAHTEVHEQFIVAVKAIEARTLSDPFSPEMVDPLRKWLEHHFISDDRHFGAFFQQHYGEGDKPINEQ